MDERAARALLDVVSVDYVDGVKRHCIVMHCLRKGESVPIVTKTEVPPEEIAIARAHSVSWLLSDYSPSERRAWLARRQYRQGQWATRDALCDWIKEYPWEWFGHLTFESCQNLQYAKNEVRRFFNRLSRRAWGRNYHKRQDEGVFAFVAFERQKRGDWHAHFVAAGTRNLRRLDAMDDWFGPVARKPKTEMRAPRRGRKPRWKRRVSRRRADALPANRRGITRIEAFDSERGGAAYATKYATKELDGDWDAIGSWRGAEMPPLLHAQGEA